MKRGQISLFLIVGLVILLGVGFYISSMESLPEVEFTSEDNNPLRTFVQSCLDSATMDSIYLAAEQGGYYSVENSLNKSVPIYWQEGILDVPSIEETQDAFAQFIQSHMFFCLAQYEDLSAEEVNLLQSEKPTVLIGREDIIVTFTTTVNSESRKIETFRSKIQFDFMRFYNAMNKIIESHLQDPTSTCITCIQEIIETYDVQIDIDQFQEDYYVYTIFDEDIPQFHYVFALHVPWYNCEKIPDYLPKKVTTQIKSQCAAELYEELV